MAGPIRIAVLANARQAKQELEGTASAAQRIGDRFSKFRAPAVGALAALALGAKSAISEATDLGETISKVGQIFGPQAKDIEAFAASAEQSLGQSKTAALDAASTFGQIGQKAGLSGTETAAFAKKFTGLASDLASFNNTTPEEAVEAIGAAMRGESEPIRKYGVLLDDATLRARALKLGLIKTTKEALTPQQKALAASQEILAQTGKAQGDFARTSEGAANKARILAAQQANLRAELGQRLLPAYVKLQNMLSATLKFFTQHQTVAKALVITVAGLATAVLVASAAQRVAGAAMAFYHGAMLAVTAATKVWTGVQAALNIVMALNPILLVVIAVVALAAAVVLAYKKSETFRRIVDGAFQAVKTGVLAVIGFFKNLPGNIAKAVGDTAKLLVGKGKNLIIGLAKGYLSLWAGVGRFFANIGLAVLRWIGNTALTLVSKGANLIIGLHAGVISRVAGFARFIGGIAGSVLRWIGNTLITLFSKGANLIIGLHQGLLSRVTGLARYVGSIGGSIGRWIGDLGRTLYNAGSQVIQGLINGIKDKLPSLISTVSPIGGIIQHFKGPLSKDKRLLTPAGKSIITGLIRGMDDELGTLQRFLRGASAMIETGLSPSPSVALAGTLKTGAAVGAAPVVHVTVQTLTGGPEVGRHVADALDDYFRTNGPRTWSKP